MYTTKSKIILEINPTQIRHLIVLVIASMVASSTFTSGAPGEDPYTEIWTTKFDQPALKARGRSVAVDKFGEAYVVGSYQKQALDQRISLAYLMKYDDEGNEIWKHDTQTNSIYSDVTVNNDYERVYYISQNGNSTRIGVADFSGGSRWGISYLSNATGKGITSDHLGNVYFTGRGSGDFFEDYEKGSGSSFLIKYNIRNEIVWKRRIGPDDPTENGTGFSEKIAVDLDGNTFVTGIAFGDFAGTNLSPKTEDEPSGKADMFLIKYDPAGAMRWMRQFGTTDKDLPVDLTVDETGSIYVIGYSDYREGDNGSVDEIIVKYDTDGTQIWKAENRGKDWDYGYSIDSGPTGAIYTSGLTIDPTTGDTFTNLYKYDPKTGKSRWGLFPKTTPGHYPVSIAVGPHSETSVADSVYVLSTVLEEPSPDVYGPGSFASLTRYLSPDTDGDGLLDDWETIGIPYTDSAGEIGFIILPDADPYHKNLYVEVDSMPGWNLSNNAIQELEDAFATAPLKNPDGTTGIILTIQRDEQNFPTIPVWQLNNDFLTGFDPLRTQYFGTQEERTEPNLVKAKSSAYRYCVYANASGPRSIGGIAQISGDNFVIFGQATTIASQAAVFMHELGHCLGLRHGGSDGINGKTNYPSIMNYALSYRFPWNAAFWELNYSTADAATLTTINESSLLEFDGISSNEGHYEDYFMPYGVTVDSAGNRTIQYAQLNGTPVDFGDEDGTQTQDGKLTGGVIQDLNYVTTNTNAKLPISSSPAQTFTPHDDWGSITLKLKAAAGGDTADATSPVPEEMTVEARIWIEENFPVPANSNYAPTIAGPTDQKIEANTPTTSLGITIEDEEDSASELILTASSDAPEVVANAGIALTGTGTNRTVVVNPVANSTGGFATVTLRVTDSGGRSSESLFTVEVEPFQDTPPSISPPPHQNVFKNATLPPFDFTVSDPDDDASELIVTATSSSQILIPDANIRLSGTGENRSIRITTTENFGDFVNINLTVTDSAGQSAETRFRLFVQDNYVPKMYVPSLYTIPENAHNIPILFTAFDESESTATLTFSATSSDQELLADEDFYFQTTDSEHSLLITPQTNKTGGPVEITITVSDSSGQSIKKTVSIEIDSADSNPWIQDSSIAKLPTPRRNLVAAVVDNKIYAIGGESGYPIKATVEEFDLSNNIWTTKQDMPTARKNMAASVANGKIYVFGGQIQVIEDDIIDITEEYNPDTNTWSEKAPTPSPRTGASAITFEGKIYLFGGRNFSEGDLARIDVFDPISNEWESKNDMPFSERHFNISAVENKIYLIGGELDPSSTWEYDPKLDQWERKADIPTPRQRLSTSVLDGMIYAIGGTPDPSSVVEIYDPSINEWTQSFNMPTARGQLATVTVSKSIYAIGGQATFENYVNSPTLSTVEKFTLLTDLDLAIHLKLKILNITHQNIDPQATLLWLEPNSDYILERSSSLSAEWILVPKTAAETIPDGIQLTVPIKTNPQFFRIRLLP